MKKLISMLLALLLVMSLSSAAFASSATYTDMSTVTLTINYNETNEGSTSPAEDLSFTISNTSVTDAASGVDTSNMPTPTLGTVSYAEGDAGDTDMTKTLTITLPRYTSVGIYTYTITQTAGDKAGVSYWASDIRLVVTVIQDTNGLLRVAAVHTEGSEGGKSDDITNTYSAGSLAVTKTVTGNMGDRSKYFAINVTLTGEADKTYAASYTVTGGTKLTDGTTDTATASISVDGLSHTFYLKHGETFTISNLPYGVTYAVTEENYTAEEDGGYDTPAYTYSDAGTTKTVDSSSETVDITNNKGAIVDTGISLDSLPYILLLVISLTGAVVFIVKRRSSRES